MVDRPILVIKLSALGDVVQAMGPFAAIRAHHPGARIVLLTTRPFAEPAEASGYFDAVWCDDRPRLTRIAAVLALRRRLRSGGFARVYDLQTSDRSGFYYRLFWPGPIPEWSGVARGCSHPHANPRRDLMHTLDRQAEQLRMAGITDVPPPDLSWATGDAARFALPRCYALVAPGGAAHRPGKRWPAERYAALGRWLAEKGVPPVLIGGSEERELSAAVRGACPEAVDLAGRTSLLDLASLARGAVAAVGNDTGPMHLAAATGCPTVVLFSNESDPALCGPRGASVTIVRRASLAEVDVDTVAAAVAEVAGLSCREPPAASPLRST